MSHNQRLNLPHRQAVKDAIERIEAFRELCKHQIDLGYWATMDFPSKHHINKLLQLQYRKKEEMLAYYGEGLTQKALSMIPVCKHYLDFIRGPNEKVEN